MGDYTYLIMSSSSASPNDILTLSLIKKLSYILVPNYCSIVNFSLYIVYTHLIFLLYLNMR